MNQEQTKCHVNKTLFSCFISFIKTKQCFTLRVKLRHTVGLQPEQSFPLGGSYAHRQLLGPAKLSAEELLVWEGVLFHLALLLCARQVVKRREGGERRRDRKDSAVSQNNSDDPSANAALSFQL